MGKQAARGCVSDLGIYYILDMREGEGETEAFRKQQETLESRDRQVQIAD